MRFWNTLVGAACGLGAGAGAGLGAGVGAGRGAGAGGEYDGLGAGAGALYDGRGAGVGAGVGAADGRDAGAEGADGRDAAGGLYTDCPLYEAFACGGAGFDIIGGVGLGAGALDTDVPKTDGTLCICPLGVNTLDDGICGIDRAFE